MSALRINVPGQPVRHIDQGPAIGRAAPSGFLNAAPVGDMTPAKWTTWTVMKAVADHPGAKFNRTIK